MYTMHSIHYTVYTVYTVLMYNVLRSAYIILCTDECLPKNFESCPTLHCPLYSVRVRCTVYVYTIPF